MIDIHHEDLISLKEATKVIPRRNGKRPHFSTVLRWCQRGIGGVKLDVCRIGGTRYTSREALQRWTDARSEYAQREPTESEKSRVANACKLLKEKGV